MIEALCFLAPIEDRSQKLWDYAVVHFPPKEIYVIDGNERSLTFRTMRNAKRIESADELPEIPLMLCSPRNAAHYKGETSLLDFDHPDQAIYLFGADDRDIEEKHLGIRSPDHLVYIPTATDDQMYAPVAYSIVSWDLIRVRQGGHPYS